MPRILIVEDTFIIAFHLEKLLKSHGYDIISKLKYAEEVQAIAQKEKPDIILMDIMLEGEMSGIECAEIIRQASDVPILFMSALSDAVTDQQIQEITHTGIINKPFDESNLLETIQQMLD